MTTHVLWVLVHSLAVVVFVNRYVAGIFLRLARGKKWDETRDDYEPTVTVVIPMFNEGEAIQETLQSLLDSDYPAHKLEVICVDDCSTDDSYEMAREVARTLGWPPQGPPQPQNLGKRRSINRAVRDAGQRDHRLGRLRRRRRSRRDPPARPPLHRATHRRGRRLGRRPQQARELADADAGREVLVRLLLHEEPRVGVPPRDVPLGLPHRVPPLGARRARAGPREPQDPRRADQVRRGSLPHPPDRQGRLPHHDDARGALPHVRADHAVRRTSRSSCAGAARTSSTTRAASATSGGSTRSSRSTSSRCSRSSSPTRSR